MKLPPNHPQIHDYEDSYGRRFEYDDEESLAVIVRVNSNNSREYTVYLTEDFEGSDRLKLLQMALKALRASEKIIPPFKSNELTSNR